MEEKFEIWSLVGLFIAGIIALGVATFLVFGDLSGSSNGQAVKVDRTTPVSGAVTPAK